MAGIFPSPTGVPAADTVNGYEPANPPIGGPARFYGPNCETTLYYWAINALTSEILAAVDRLGYAYNPTRVDNLGAALAEVIGNIELTLTAAVSDIGALQGDMTAAEAAITALQSAVSTIQGDLIIIGNDITAIDNYLANLEAAQVKLVPAIGGHNNVRSLLEAMYPYMGSMPNLTVKGNNAGAAAPPQDLTMATLASMLPLAGGSKGLMPPLSGVLTDYFRGNGTWGPNTEAVPVGAVLGFAMTTAPAGWLKANGAAVDLLIYSGLLAIYCGDAANPTAEWGYRCTNPASPSATRSITGGYIVLPDRRGVFERGWSDGHSVDSGRSLWARQAHAYMSHTHPTADPLHQHQVVGGPNAAGSGTAGFAGQNANSYIINTQLAATGVTVNATGGTETRPVNDAALICIKY